MKTTFFALIVSMLFFSCGKDESIPANSNQALTTTVIDGITISSALTGGNITDDGGAAITARGVCWGTTSNPTINGDHTTDGSGIGKFRSAITGLVTGSTYYVRAYYSNSTGTIYGNEETYTASGPFVYVAGADSSNVKVWKNGVAATLNSPSVYGEAKSVFVTETAVYVAGFVNGGANNVATVWKNGDPISLTDGTVNAVAISVFVSGADVYAAGYENAQGGSYVAKVWKNGTGTSLTDGTSNGYAGSVFVSGPDVYVTGYENNPLANGSFAKIWKNGVGTSLSDGATLGTGSSVFVSGTDVYVAGTTNGTGTIWKNGVATSLSNPGAGESSTLNSVHVSGTDVYACGSFISGGALFTRVWKNSIPTTLTNGTIADLSSVFVYGTDVYASGYETIGSGTVSTATVWRNGVRIGLTNGNSGAFGRAVFVI